MLLIPVQIHHIVMLHQTMQLQKMHLLLKMQLNLIDINGLLGEVLIPELQHQKELQIFNKEVNGQLGIVKKLHYSQIEIQN